MDPDDSAPDGSIPDPCGDMPTNDPSAMADLMVTGSPSGMVCAVAANVAMTSAGNLFATVLRYHPVESVRGGGDITYSDDSRIAGLLIPKGSAGFLAKELTSLLAQVRAQDN